MNRRAMNVLKWSFLGLLLTSFTGCAPTRDVRVDPPREPIPQSYVTGLPECEWDGDRTYEGLIRFAKEQSHCIGRYRKTLEQIKRWDAQQQKNYAAQK